MGIGTRTALRVRKKNLKNPFVRQEVGVAKVGSKQDNTVMKYNRKRDPTWYGGAVQALQSKQMRMYEPPRLQELKWQNRLKTKKHYLWRNPPHAPRNTSTYILQSKKAGAFEFLTSPVVDSASLAPVSSPLPLYKDGVVEEVKQWGVDGYGSMTNLIRLRSSSDDDEQMGAVHFDGTVNSDGVQSGDNGVHSMRGVEQRLEQDLVRFELTYPPRRMEDQYCLQRKVEEQEQQIAFLEDENLTLRERVYILQQETGDMRQRLGLANPARLDVPDDAYSELVDPFSDAV